MASWGGGQPTMGAFPQPIPAPMMPLDRMQLQPTRPESIFHIPSPIMWGPQQPIGRAIRMPMPPRQVQPLRGFPIGMPGTVGARSAEMLGQAPVSPLMNFFNNPAMIETLRRMQGA